LQPADVGWFHTLKNLYKKDWNEWFQSTDIKLVTRFGNLCGPGYQRMINWIVKGWNQLEPLAISESFQYCGITSTNVEKYHQTLKKILNTSTNPINITVEPQEEDECLFRDVFLTNVCFDETDEKTDSEDEDEPRSDDDEESSDISSIYSDDGEPDIQESKESASKSINSPSISKISSCNPSKVLRKSPRTPSASNSSITITKIPPETKTTRSLNMSSSQSTNIKEVPVPGTEKKFYRNQRLFNQQQALLAQKHKI
jgi:hypothetical protein